MKKGFLNISIGIILIFFSVISSVLLSYLLKDALHIQEKVLETVDNTYTKIMFISGANVWKKFLTDNAAFWDYIQSESDFQKNTTFTWNAKFKYNLNTYREINYTLLSTTTVYIYVDKYINVIFGLKKDGKGILQGVSFDFGWPGI
ncbi:hypothetical protein SU69_04590 [Thermosipho melanesiensis]|uniref:Uncharacterized protein n=2 Tax=Thermosipho melanesiensis TaxID=46541 RepID=A6LLF9_THEM4|nr:hypothetical protein [Thermosipho melanesiensis]ABR30760.1 hypothetical protein Tmel_0899 [Thermosipho melanesiensis BI429]APT73883.1 hypothetical protein BW47_04825 [Thermosipho melanesiensis]OOC35824.1 hypothetical protein SU68_04645 [Thermosipho melanesiensis]OOC38326.1 hypothetical protein SU69_04590 [Thermosipho melanesiensis]OOC38787.1 hypothetical protein SU70_04590 [Thermosipho melanesiensis]